VFANPPVPCTIPQSLVHETNPNTVLAIPRSLVWQTGCHRAVCNGFFGQFDLEIFEGILMGIEIAVLLIV
jgi:hypothetical protein